jgi:hypothetical protein
MDGFDPAEYFQEHPERWMAAVAGTGLAAVLSFRRLFTAHGFFGKLSALVMLAIQVGVMVGLVGAKNRSEEAAW